MATTFMVSFIVGCVMS